MKLITEDFNNLLANYPFGSQRNNDNPIAVIKLYVSDIAWHLIEYDKNDKRAFAFIT